VVSLQLTSDGSSSQCAPVRRSSARWNDKRNDVLDLQSGHLVESTDDRPYELSGVVLYPSRTRPPDWVHELLDVVVATRPLIDSATVDGLTSDTVFAHLRPGLLKLGYEVEGGKHRTEKFAGRCCSATTAVSGSP
jgi:hypothetical protein